MSSFLEFQNPARKSERSDEQQRDEGDRVIKKLLEDTRSGFPPMRTESQGFSGTLRSQEPPNYIEFNTIRWAQEIQKPVEIPMSVRRTLDDPYKQLDNLNEALRLATIVFGPNTVQTAEIHNRLGDVYGLTGNIPAAVSEYYQVLTIQESMYGANSPKLIDTLACLAEAKRSTASAVDKDEANKLDERIRALTTAAANNPNSEQQQESLDRPGQSISEGIALNSFFLAGILADSKGAPTITTLSNLAEVCHSFEKNVEAGRYHSMACDIAFGLVNREPTKAENWDLAQSTMLKYVTFLEKTDRADEAKEWKNRIEETRKAKEELFPKPETEPKPSGA